MDNPSRRTVLGGSAAVVAGTGLLLGAPAQASASTSDCSGNDQLLLTLVQRHLEAEVVQRDLDAVMATVASDPVWAFQPLGYIVTGRTAVRESYRRLIAGFFPYILPGANHGQWFTGNAMVTEDDIVLQLRGGGQLTAPVISVLVFDGDLLSSERVYLGSGLAKYVRDALGPDFPHLAGVTTFSRSQLGGGAPGTVAWLQRDILGGSESGKGRSSVIAGSALCAAHPP